MLEVKKKRGDILFLIWVIDVIILHFKNLFRLLMHIRVFITKSILNTRYQLTSADNSINTVRSKKIRQHKIFRSLHFIAPKIINYAFFHYLLTKVILPKSVSKPMSPFSSIIKKKDNNQSWKKRVLQVLRNPFFSSDSPPNLSCFPPNSY